jgi:hypothetical protein
MNRRGGQGPGVPDGLSANPKQPPQNAGPLESSTIVEAVLIVVRLIFVFHFTCSHGSPDTAPILPVP